MAKLHKVGGQAQDACGLTLALTKIVRFNHLTAFKLFYKTATPLKLRIIIWAWSVASYTVSD